MSGKFIKYTIETAKPEARPLLESSMQAYGFVPNVYAFMAESPVALKSYAALEINLKSSHFFDDELHLAMLVISINNGCKFCSTAHRLMALGAGVAKDTVDSIYKSGVSNNEIYRPLISLINLLMSKKGQLEDNEVDEFIKLGFTQEKIIEAITIIALKTISNYSNRLCEASPNKELLNNI